MSKIKCAHCGKVYDTADYETPEDFITKAEEHRDDKHPEVGPVGRYLDAPASREKYPRVDELGNPVDD